MWRASWCSGEVRFVYWLGDGVVAGDEVGVVVVLLGEMAENVGCDELRRFVVGRGVDVGLRVRVNALLESMLRVGVARYCEGGVLGEDEFLGLVGVEAELFELVDCSAKRGVVAFVTGGSGAPLRVREAALELIGNLTLVSVMCRETGFSPVELVGFLGE